MLRLRYHFLRTRPFASALMTSQNPYDDLKLQYQSEWARLQSEWPTSITRKALIKVQHSLGLLHRIEGDFEAAEPHYQQALELALSEFGESHMETASQRNYLAGLYFAWEKFDSAESLIKTGLEYYEASLGSTHEITAVASFALALVTRRGRVSRANVDMAMLVPGLSKGYYDRSLPLFDIDIKTLSMDDSHDVFRALMHLSHESFAAGRFEEAEELFRHAILTELQEIWPKHPLVTDSYQLLGDLYRAASLPKQSEILYRKALDARREVYGEQQEKVASSAHSLGSLLASLSRYEEAEPLLRVSCDIRRAGSFPPVLANSLKEYAMVLSALGRKDEAQALESEADAIYERHGHQRHS